MAGQCVSDMMSLLKLWIMASVLWGKSPSDGRRRKN